MRAIVLVGGFGTRLRPLTSDLPKQMLPVVDRPMIEHVVGHLAANGVDEVVLSLGFLPDAFREAYPDGACAGVPLHYAVEPEPLDTAGAIRFAAEDAGIDDTFLVLNGDVLTDLPFGELVEAHRATGAEGTISLTPVDDPSRYGVVPTDGSGRVLGFVEKPVPGDGALFGYQSTAYWVDTGTPETYLGVQLDLLDGEWGPAAEGVDSLAVIAAGADVRRSVIGPGAVVAEGARVCDAVVMAEATIAEGARVEGSLVGSGARVGVEASVLDLTVLGHGAAVAAGECLVGARRPDEA